MTLSVLSSYQRVLGELQAAIGAVDVNGIILVGDFNADPNIGRLWLCLSDFVLIHLPEPCSQHVQLAGSCIVVDQCECILSWR